MNELERAVTTLLDRPPATPAPLEMIERRAGTLRRRRRLLETGGIAVVLLLLGTAGLALSAARNDDDQGVFVGEGPSTPANLSEATYQMDSPVDGATAEALKQAIEARFRWAWAGDVVVTVDGTEVTVSAPSTVPAQRFDALVTSPGGFQLRTVSGDAPEAECWSAGGGYGSPQALWTSSLAGPPRCLFVDPPIELPSPPSITSGMSGSPAGGYQTELVLTAAASEALVSDTAKCPTRPCVPGTLAITTGGGILHPEAQLTEHDVASGPEVQVVVPGFTDEAEAELWAAVLVHPLPEGVLLSRVEPTPSTSATTVLSTSDSDVGSPFPTSGASSSVLCLASPVDDTTLASAASVLEARFADIGRTVSVQPYLPTGGGGDGVGCPSGLTLLLSSDYPPSDPDWVRDQAAMMAPGVLRTVNGGTVLHPVSAVVQAADPQGADLPKLVIVLPPDEFSAYGLQVSADCAAPRPCGGLLAVDGDGWWTSDVVYTAGASSVIIGPTVADEGRLRRVASVLSHPLPEGVSPSRPELSYRLQRDWPKR